MNALRSILFALVFYPGTGLVRARLVPMALFGTGPMRRHVRGWALFHRFCARHILGIRSRVEGPVPAGAVLVAAKHQSMFETLEVVLLLDQPAVVMKRQLADIPFFGRVTLLYGCIPVDRDGGAVALRRMLRAAEAAIAGCRPIVIFPGRHQGAPGDSPALQAGSRGLYRALKLPWCRSALAAAGSGPAASSSGRHRDDALRRSDPARLKRPRSKPPSTPRSTRSSR